MKAQTILASALVAIAALGSVSVGSAQADNWRDWRRHEFNQQQRYFNRFVRNQRRDYRQFRNHHNNWYGNHPRVYGQNRWYGYNRYYNLYW